MFVTVVKTITTQNENYTNQLHKTTNASINCIKLNNNQTAATNCIKCNNNQLHNTNCCNPLYKT